MKRSNKALFRGASVLAMVSFTLTVLAQPLARQERARGTGLLLSSPQTLSRLENIRVMGQEAERPSHLELREYMPVIGDQGQQGSCVGWATGYYLYTYALAKRKALSAQQLADVRFQCSPAFIYNRADRGWENGREVNRGMYISEAMETLEKKGCATLTEMPYDEKQNSVLPDEETLTKAQGRRARRLKALPFEKGASGIEEIKTFLAVTKTPVVMAIPTYGDFHEAWDKGDDFVYRLTRAASSDHGWHAVTICGYDEARKALLMVNSWGARFGNNGYLWLSEDFVQEHAREVWGVVEAGGARALGSGPVNLGNGLYILPRKAK